MDHDFTYLSLGAGTQSTAMLAMSNRGDHGVPRADVAIFADTGGEPQWVYENLERIKELSAIPVHVVSAGDLMQDVIDCHNGRKSRFAAIPAFTQGADGRAAPLRRQCTREYKVEPIEKEVRRMLGYRPRQRVKHRVRCLVGISVDEFMRCRDNPRPWIKNAYPLIDANLRREHCVSYLKKIGWPVAGKSSCVFCPYHRDGYWRELKEKYPVEFQKAVEADAAIRDMSMSGVKQPVYLHRSLKPLDQVDFGGDEPTLFDNGMLDECEGLCGT